MMLRRTLAAVGSSARMLVLAGGVTALGLGCSQAPSPASVRFTDVTEAAGVTYLQQNLREEGSCLLDGGFDGPGRGTFCDPERMSGGAAAGDYDNDGFVDLYVTRLDAPDILFRNKGDGTFEDVTAAAGLGAFLLKSNGAVWADIDNDGHQDLYVTTIADTRFYLFMNDGLGGFTEEAISATQLLKRENSMSASAWPSETTIATAGWTSTQTSGAHLSSPRAPRRRTHACCETWERPLQVTSRT